jgi:hypothetical protein
LRYFGVVEIAARRQPSGRAYLRREKSHLIALHQAARLLQGFRRAVAIVGQHQLELAPIHAALGVDQVKPCRHGLADDAIACGRAAERSGRADLDLAIRHARVPAPCARTRPETPVSMAPESMVMNCLFCMMSPVVVVR